MFFLSALEATFKTSYEHELCIKSLTNIQNLDKKETKVDLLNILVSSNETMARYILYTFTNIFDTNDENTLISFLQSKDIYIRFKSCEILTNIYIDEIPRNEYLQFIKQNLHGNSYDEIDQVLYFLVQLLYNKKDSLRVENCSLFNRNILKINFCQDLSFIEHLNKYIMVKEVQYHVLKILFILSYDINCLKVIEDRKVVNDVVRILKSRSSEKIMRVCVSIVKNFLMKGFTFTIMTSQDIIDVCSESEYIDMEMLDEMKYIKDVLTHHMKTSSNIDSYFKELFGGRLEEAPYHYSSSFWESNLPILLENKSKIIKAIKKYLKSTNNTYVCVAANDLYRFVKVAPEIKHYIEKYGVKDELFVLLESTNADVKYFSIQALSLCICSDWIHD